MRASCVRPQYDLARDRGPATLALLSFAPACMYVTHYSRLTDVPRLADRVLSMLDAMVGLAQRLRDAPDRHATLKRELTALYAASLVEHGVERVPEKVPLLAMDIELNAQGIGVWLDRQAKEQKEGTP